MIVARAGANALVFCLFLLLVLPLICVLFIFRARAIQNAALQCVPVYGHMCAATMCCSPYRARHHGAMRLGQSRLGIPCVAKRSDTTEMCAPCKTQRSVGMRLCGGVGVGWRVCQISSSPRRIARRVDAGTPAMAGQLPGMPYHVHRRN